jgi:hypothetical protein
MLRKTLMAAVLAVAVAALSVSVAADDWTKWSDNKFGIEFELPGSFKVIQNTEETFVAHSEDFVVAIVNWKDASLTAQDALVAALNEIESCTVKEVQIFEERDFPGDAQGYEMLGTATDDGEDVEFGVVAIIDPSSDRNIIMYTFYKGDEDSGNFDTERRIIESVTLKH